jgi:paraquat-inducible protein A
MSGHPMTAGSLIACHECDLLQRIPRQRQGGKAYCRRCNALLHRSVRDSLDRTLALTFAGLVLFIVANAFPFLSFKMEGQVTQTTLATGVLDLYRQGMWEIALLVLLTSMLVPLLQLLLLIYILLPLKFNRTPWQLASVFRLLQNLGPWGMMEVFMLGILVSVVKLLEMAQIIPGLALWSFALLIFVLAGAAAALDPEIVWERVGSKR